jgi:hypothetical protein
MVFVKRPREGVVQGKITCSVRIWTSPHVKEGKRYRMGVGEIEVDSVTLIGFADITPELARESGFLVCSICSKWRSMAKATTSI